MPTRPPIHRPHPPRPQARASAAQPPREKTAARGYGGRWQKARSTFLARNPLCAECERNGRATPARVVDHVVPHKGDQDKFWQTDNWQALCSACHSAKTAREDGGFGNRSTGPRSTPRG